MKRIRKVLRRVSWAYWLYAIVSLTCTGIHAAVRNQLLGKNEQTFMQHYGMHFIAPLGLILLISLGFTIVLGVGGLGHTTNSLIITGSTLLVVTICEIAQYWSPTRVFDVLDLLMQFAGSALALSIMLIAGPPKIYPKVKVHSGEDDL